MSDFLESGPITWRDGLTLLAGDRLGSGITRDVYVCTLDEDFVVKRERNGGSSVYFQNTQEWALWDSIRHRKDIARWFAPCLKISYAGLWLVQKRTRPISVEDIKRRLPMVPAFFTDLKAENWGVLDRRIVCHDYGLMLTRDHALSSARMKKADWT